MSVSVLLATSCSSLTWILEEGGTSTPHYLHVGGLFHVILTKTKQKKGPEC